MSLPLEGLLVVSVEQAVAAPYAASRLAAAAGFPAFAPDACLINRYAAGAGMGLHQDRNERDYDAPVVSVSFGVPATFLWGGETRTAPVRKVRLEHGDVVVWGGASRLRYHGVSPLAAGSRVCRAGDRAVDRVCRGREFSRDRRGRSLADHTAVRVHPRLWLRGGARGGRCARRGGRAGAVAVQPRGRGGGIDTRRGRGARRLTRTAARTGREREQQRRQHEMQELSGAVQRVHT